MYNLFFLKLELDEIFIFLMIFEVFDDLFIFLFFFGDLLILG